MEYVIESTGLFVEAEKAAGHIEAGAKKVPFFKSWRMGSQDLENVVSIYNPPVYKPKWLLPTYKSWDDPSKKLGPKFKNQMLLFEREVNLF